VGGIKKSEKHVVKERERECLREMAKVKNISSERQRKRLRVMAKVKNML
jgi:hypothetical protein